jgi:DNA modification methylase
VNTLYYGDNLQILREHIKDESVDLIYLDPPFNSNANYNVLFKGPSGERSHAQIEAFEDTWHWTDEAEQAFDEVMQGGNADASELLRAIRAFLKENDMMAYLTMMAIRLLELHRVLKDTGSIYLHCDPTASHYLKILMDSIFGATNFRNEIVWKRTSAHSSTRGYGAVHDTILFFGKTDSFEWNDQYGPYDEQYVEAFFTHVDAHGRRWRRENLTGPGVRKGDSGLPWRDYDPTAKGRHWQPPSCLYDKYAAITGEELANYPLMERLEKMNSAGLIHWPAKPGGMPHGKRLLEDAKGIPLQDIWADIKIMHNMSAERLGYATQKPQSLLERIIQSSSNEGDLVLDPFCGCGTTIHAAQKLNRQWIGIDITNLAISLIEKRLADAFPGIEFEVHGTPKDMDGARALAARDKYQFQWWAVSLVKAVPYGGKKKGADTGIDGFIYFKPDARTTEKAIVSVKGGENINVAMIRDLGYVVKREKAQMGIFITLAEPTKPMLTEAVKEGFYETVYGKFPRLQIVTVADLLDGKRPDIPLIDRTASGFKIAAKEGDTTEQDFFPF